MPAGWTLTLADYIDPLGGVYNTNPLTLVSSRTFTGPVTTDTFNTSATADFVSGYSFTEKYVISASGIGNTENIIQASVPEPGSLLLLGTAVIGLGFARRRATGAS